MELHPSTAPLPPLLAEVRRRHPDVDIVVLPDEEAGSAATDEVGDAEVAAARQRVDDEAAALVDLLGADLPPVVLGYGPDRGTVRARTRATSVRADGAEALHRLDSSLTARGWAVSRPSDGLPRLVARTSGVEVSASWAEQSGAFVVEVSSGSLPVGETRARTLVRR